MGVKTRRNFLGTAAVAAASGAAAGCGGARGNWRYFTEQEARILDALLECIIPSDGDAGAREAGVIHYIDRQLTGRFREHQKTYRVGLAALLALPDAPPGNRQRMLLEMERDPARRPFFDLVITHAMQGFYGNPRHGGNRNFVSWRMLGIPPLPVRGREQYDSTRGGGNAKG